METEKYNIEYSCGCVHELRVNDTDKNEAFHQPTGNNKDCDTHKKVVVSQ